MNADWEQYKIAREEHLNELEDIRGAFVKEFVRLLEQIPSLDLRAELYDATLNLRESDYQITIYKERY